MAIVFPSFTFQDPIQFTAPPAAMSIAPFSQISRKAADEGKMRVRRYPLRAGGILESRICVFQFPNP
jgi:hypothetical protein